MEKDFDAWNIQKKRTHARNETIVFHEREVWWCSLGVNVGFEQDGKHELFERPILVVRKFNRDILLVVPLTHSNKSNSYYYRLNGGENNSVVILSQLRLISSKRLLRVMYKISRKEFTNIASLISRLILPINKSEPHAR